ncbi:SixA phosphatase family protein [Cyclobacterium plantarum]|uniref:SixA phosphatase family protein n=1 Tax=Cyclobacterium plantarum TaxID=2716263 RepID=UPI003F715529
MVKELLLARHGEAVSPNIEAVDADRNLTAAGRQQVDRLGNLLAINRQKCQLMVYSPALRCRLTAEILGKYLEPESRLAVPFIYRADRDELLFVINGFPAEVNQVLLVGHNPAISMIAAYLTGEDHLMFSPGMMARLQFRDLSWDMLSKNSGTLEEILQ